MIFEGPCLDHCYECNKLNLLFISVISINIGYLICKLKVKNIINKRK
jgi:hypothetical protein